MRRRRQSDCVTDCGADLDPDLVPELGPPELGPDGVARKGQFSWSSSSS